jgi:LmbE family N-acetylglucosaminyl deacetylase
MTRRLDARTARQRAQATEHRDLLERILAERLLVLAPHMDDETLACGGTVLLHQDPREIHCLFATDGAGSPAPLLPWLGRSDSGLAARRRTEAVAAAGLLGLPARNLRFLDFPDGGLAACHDQLAAALAEALDAVRPAFVFAPFRFDVHPDHVALNRGIRDVLRARRDRPVLLEYFVYHRLRFAPGGDVRNALETGRLLAVDTRHVAAAKRAALDCYVSQTTLGYPWQDRPILAEESLHRRCAEPEYFLPSDPGAPLAEGFATAAGRVRLASLAMRLGKRPKDQAAAFFRWALGR